jgi:hypothetical protein
VARGVSQAYEHEPAAMTPTEHQAQKALVMASERISPDKTERHNCYPKRPGAKS